ncbi:MULTISPECIES: Tic20 family protein [unclassified Nostoc]|uniref:Tic20 family protein n=1 Tax=unclassified Nostoc TaxID=2593658 RepID=UPI002AD48822|nr:Tic20 family protein [Nostoc sp. DedQUE03]MDZ7977595.1 Tic20 family protein [Nostoc sp. DedQUE03]MDZ8049370.1 Tic20 family protein [Nostoc sp. DedQUE02]
MSWRGSTTVSDRIFASLPYLLPLIEVFVFGRYLLSEFPPLQLLFLPLLPLLRIYYGVRYAGMIIFFALFLLVVRNEKISHFIRFNTMQAILLDIIIFLFSILTDVVGLVPSGGFAIQTLSTTIFIGIVGAAAYSVILSVSGRYAEIPAISDAVYMQVR